jgi:hypothetical protein
MSVNIQTAEDAWLEGKAVFEEWQERFDADWYEPLTRSLFAILAARMAPDELEALAAMNPQGYDMLERIVTGGVPRGTPGGTPYGQS